VRRINKWKYFSLKVCKICRKTGKKKKRKEKNVPRFLRLDEMVTIPSRQKYFALTKWSPFRQGRNILP
jgi:hypothetical protein